MYMTTGRSKARQRVLVIANPTAGHANRARFKAIIERIEGHGSAVTTYETKATGDAERWVRNIDRAAFDVIAAAGGDGTINEVLNGLPANAPPLAILPLGTVNVLAREIALPPSIDAIADAVAFGPARPINLGEVNGRRFAVMASVGLDARAVEGVNLNLKRHIGKWAYLFETLRQIILSLPSAFQLRLDDAESEAYGVVVANGRHYGGRYVTSPAAHLEKPSLDVCRLTRPGRLAAPGYLLSLFLGRFALRTDVEIVEATDLEILGPVGAPVQADGDILCRLPATIRILPSAVDLVFPATAKDARAHVP
ncbi:MAG: diacylglycerol/lipid kinase family protein [Geminicoccaceae bacterium]